jgi:hypothetical protein
MDVADDERLRAQYPELVARRTYNASIGGALSDHRVALGLTSVSEKKGRGMTWRKLTQTGVPASSRKGTAAAALNLESAVAEDRLIGPQCSSDNTFTARMRRHQSWYRANVLRVPYGTGPGATATSQFGNMLTRADGEAGRNFLTREIAEVARARVAQGAGAVEPFRLFHNMLSSQPMCFNLFGPLARDAALATRLLPTLVPGPVAAVTRVVLEWAPAPSGDYLGDRTAFDAFIEYRTTDGGLHALGIETKLTESFSAKVYDREEYRRWMRVPDRPWLSDADERVSAVEHNQLWRDHLLAVAIRHHVHSPYATTGLLVVHHPEDQGCTSVYAGYRALLRNGDSTLSSISLDRIVNGWAKLTEPAARAAWLDPFRVRYLDLALSAS